MSLREIIKKMSKDVEFANFMAELLCAYERGDEGAEECLKRFFEAEEVEVQNLCIREEVKQLCKVCTDQAALLSAPAFAFSSSRRKSR